MEKVFVDGHGWCQVWDLPKVSPKKQREGRYVPESFVHPAKMDVGLCRKIIETYTEPGQIVLDPMAGISTTIIEAAYLGRNSVGVELEERGGQKSSRETPANFPSCSERKQMWPCSLPHTARG